MMEKTIKILTAVGCILGGLGEILKQYNISKNHIKQDVDKALADSNNSEEKSNEADKN